MNKEIMTTQTEEIVWHKYPEEKPEKRGVYLISYCATKDLKIVHIAIYSNGEFRGEFRIEGRLIQNVNIIAWAKLPKGWRDEYSDYPSDMAYIREDIYLDIKRRLREAYKELNDSLVSDLELGWVKNLLKNHLPELEMVSDTNQQESTDDNV